MIVIPATEEQEMLAIRIDELGCGIHISRQDASRERLTEAVRGVLADPAYGNRCKTIAGSFRQADGAALAADRVEALSG